MEQNEMKETVAKIKCIVEENKKIWLLYTTFLHYDYILSTYFYSQNKLLKYFQVLGQKSELLYRAAGAPAPFMVLLWIPKLQKIDHTWYKWQIIFCFFLLGKQASNLITILLHFFNFQKTMSSSLKNKFLLSDHKWDLWYDFLFFIGFL